MQNEQNTGESKNIFWVGGSYDTGCKKCLLLKNSQYFCCGLLPMKMRQNYNWIVRYKPFPK